MKFIFVFIAVLAICSCSADLQAKYDKKEIMECVNGAKPILEKLLDIVYAVQNKQLDKIVAKGRELFNLVKESIGKCLKQTGEINLNVAPLVVIKVVIAVGSAIYNGYKLVQAIRNK